MTARRALPVILALATILFFRTAAKARADGALFEGTEPLALTIKAPLQQLFDKGTDDNGYSVPAEVTIEGQPPAQASLTVRGHTSKNEVECTFPKLKLKFSKEHPPASPLLAAVHTLKLGTHCGEAKGEQLSDKYGRLANEKSPWRETLVYRLVAAVGVPTLRARAARVTYVDTSPSGTIVPSPVTRNALLLEDDDDAMQRLGATGEITPEKFTSADAVFAVADSARLAFAEAMIGNFDWCLQFTPDDTYRCDARRKLWNLLALRRSDGTAFPLMKDFDLAGPVPGRHIWFDKVFNRAFTNGSAPEAEVLAQVQRTRSVFTRAVLDATRQDFLQRRPKLYEMVRDAPLDPHGRELATAYLDSFFKGIGTDAEFYRRVIVSQGVRMYTRADKALEPCQTGDTVPVGTPVNERGRDAGMAQVDLLDALWHWAPPHRCDAAQKGPVWVDAGAIGADYPKR